MEFFSKVVSDFLETVTIVDFLSKINNVNSFGNTYPTLLDKMDLQRSVTDGRPCSSFCGHKVVHPFRTT